MASVVGICNVALAQIRAGSINSLDEASLQAQQCKLHYQIAVDQCLSETDWGFNHELRALSALDIEIHGWRYCWQYPSDCLRINGLVRNMEDIDRTNPTPDSRYYEPHITKHPRDLPKVEHRVFNVAGNRVIVTNEPTMRLDYRKKVDDPNLFSSDFTMAVSYLLAHYVAVPIVGVKDGMTLRQSNLQLYVAFMAKAEDQNASSQYTEPAESEFITVRG